MHEKKSSVRRGQTPVLDEQPSLFKRRTLTLSAADPPVVPTPANGLDAGAALTGSGASFLSTPTVANGLVDGVVEGAAAGAAAGVFAKKFGIAGGGPADKGDFDGGGGAAGVVDPADDDGRPKPIELGRTTAGESVDVLRLEAKKVGGLPAAAARGGTAGVVDPADERGELVFGVEGKSGPSPKVNGFGAATPPPAPLVALEEGLAKKSTGPTCFLTSPTGANFSFASPSTIVVDDPSCRSSSRALNLPEDGP